MVESEGEGREVRHGVTGVRQAEVRHTVRRERRSTERRELHVQREGEGEKKDVRWSNKARGKAVGVEDRF